MVTTFLPYPSFQQSIACLDDKRLCKQRLECKQIINVLCSGSSTRGYANHPATNMWRGYENALIYYYNLCVYEWIGRGKNNTMEYIPYGEVVMPWWLGWSHFHLSHQAALLRKDQQHYIQHFQPIEYYYQRGYIWPSYHNELVMQYSIAHPELMDTIYNYGRPLFNAIS